MIYKYYVETEGNEPTGPLPLEEARTIAQSVRGKLIMIGGDHRVWIERQYDFNDSELVQDYTGMDPAESPERAKKIALALLGRHSSRRVTDGSMEAGRLIQVTVQGAEWRLLRCLETGLWWRRNSAGYTDRIVQAGLYTIEHAERVVYGSPTTVGSYTVVDAIEIASGLTATTVDAG